MSQKDTKTYKGHVGYPVVSTQRVSILNKAECRRIAKWIDFRKAEVAALCVWCMNIIYLVRYYLSLNRVARHLNLYCRLYAAPRSPGTISGFGTRS
jgi:hypothetical protein